MDQATHNAAIVREAMQAVFAEQRLDQIDRYFAPDFVQHSPYAAPGGRDELTQWWSAVIAAIPDVTTEVEQTVATADRVAVFRVVRGTVRGEIPGLGVKGDGQPVEFRVADLFTLRDGKIVAHREVADTGPLVILSGGR